MKKTKVFLCLMLLTLMTLTVSLKNVKAETNASVTFSTNVEIKKTTLVNPDGSISETAPVMEMNSYGKEITDQAVKAKLDAAYSEIKETKDLGELVPALDNVAKQIDSKYNSSVFSPVALFDVTTDTPIPEGGYIAVTFDLGAGYNYDSYGVIHQNEATGKWIACSNQDVNVLADGTIEVYFTSFCPVVILGVTPENLKVDGSLALYIILGVEALAVVFLIGSCARRGKKEKR